MGAITAFALSVIVSVILVRAQASLMEHLPLQDPDGNAVSIYRFTVTRAVSVRQLANLQLGLLILRRPVLGYPETRSLAAAAVQRVPSAARETDIATY